jgi:uncharacterized protein (TIGR03067 family)
MLLPRLGATTAILLMAVAVGPSGHVYRTQAAQPGQSEIQRAIPLLVAETNAQAERKSKGQGKGNAPKNDAARSDKERIRGTWRLVKVEVNGVEVPTFIQPKEGLQATFTSEKWTSNFMEGNGFTFKLDPTGKPKAIDLHPLEDADKTLLGIYKLDDNGLTICFCQRGKQERPAALDNYWRAESYTALVVLRRQADKIDKPLETLPVPPSSQPATFRSEVRDFRIPVSMRPDLRDKVKRLHLNVSTDGETWREVLSIPPTSEAFLFHAPKDGTYWFALRVEPSEGGTDSGDTPRPALIVVVETTNK